MTDVDPDAYVVRFQSWTPEGLMKTAKREKERVDRYRISTFVDARRPGETDHRPALRRIMEDSKIKMPPANNPKFRVCQPAQELIDRGFTFCKDGDDDEEELHFSVDLGDITEHELEGAVLRFLEPFTPGRRVDVYAD